MKRSEVTGEEWELGGEVIEVAAEMWLCMGWQVASGVFDVAGEMREVVWRC